MTENQDHLPGAENSPNVERSGPKGWWDQSHRKTVLRAFRQKITHPFQLGAAFFLPPLFPLGFSLPRPVVSLQVWLDYFS